MMIRKLFYCLTTVTMLTSACSTDFDLTSDWKDITIVYGLLNHTDTAQYIKINKAFLDPKTNALELAQIEDSVFYQSLTVKLEEVDGTFSDDLQKVDGNLEGYPKEPGTFISSPNWLYKYKHNLNPNKTYRLRVIKDDGNEVTAETKIVNNLTVIKPFATTEPTQQLYLVPGTNTSYTVSWQNAKNASFYGLTLRFWYSEYPFTNPSDSSIKYFDWQVFSNYVPSPIEAGATIEYKIYGNSFYETIAQHIPVDQTVIRKVLKIDFNFAAGGNELYTYYLVNQAQQGLTSGQIGPEYTNVNGGLGVLSSRLYKNVNDVLLKQGTIDSIACHYRTRDLNFLTTQGIICP